MISHLYIALCVYHLMSNLLLSPYICPPLTFTFALLPLPLVTTMLLPVFYELLFACFSGLFICSSCHLRVHIHHQHPLYTPQFWVQGGLQGDWSERAILPGMLTCTLMEAHLHHSTLHLCLITRCSELWCSEFLSSVAYFE